MRSRTRANCCCGLELHRIFPLKTVGYGDTDQRMPNQDKAYGRAALVPGAKDTEDILKRFRSVEDRVGELLEGVHVTPSLLHGDLWIGKSSSYPCLSLGMI